MAVVRSVRTRMVEGLIRDFKADTDAVAYFSAGFYSGPLLHDNIKRQRQVNVVPLSNAVFEPGVTGAQSGALIPILVYAFFPPQGTAFVLTEKTPQDYLEHLAKIVLAGSQTGNPNPNNPGFILDPDWSGSPSDGLRWLNTAQANIAFSAPLAEDGNTAILLGFIASFVTRLNNTTLARV